MFVELKKMLENATGVTLVISAIDAGLQVVVSPKATEGSNAGLVRPLVLKGTPEELDEGFVETLSGYINVRKTLADQLAIAQADIEASAKAAAAEAKEKKTQSAKSKSPAVTKPAQKAKPAKFEDADHDDDPLFKSSEGESSASPEEDASASGETEVADAVSSVNIFSKED